MPRVRNSARSKMFKHTLIPLVVGLLCTAATASAGMIYKVQSRNGDQQLTYEVRFGGGKLEELFTAFDPNSKKFVYLSFPRDGEPPAPAMIIWDHRTGEKVPLYAFPGVKDPLPVIPNIQALKVCPLTGDKNFRAEIHIFID